MKLRKVVGISAILASGAGAWACTGDLSGGAGSGGGGSGPPGGAGGVPGGGDGGVIVSDLPCPVQALLKDRCSSCHNDSPDRIAPMALGTRADLLAPAKSDASKTVGQRAVERMHATSNFMPPSGRLPDETIAPFDAWVAEGMPAGSCVISGGGGNTSRPFEPLAADAALAKVKTFLTGRAPDESEYSAFRANTNTLPQMIDGFLKAPEFAERAKEMLTLLFQQRTDGDDFGSYLRFGDNNNLRNIQNKSGILFSDYINQSFALTAWDLVQRDRPFKEAITTRTYQLNVPLMALLARMDAKPRDDLNKGQKSFLETDYPTASLSYLQDQVIPWADSINPASPNFMKFGVIAPNGNVTQCGTALTKVYTGAQAFDQVWQAMLRVPGNDSCWTTPSPLPDLFTAEDRVFRPVTVRLAAPGEKHTLFWDIDSLRRTSQLVLGVDYVGFFGNLGFLGYWTTNDGNEYRVTTNQALIVALGKTFTTDSTSVVADSSGVDEAHATPGSVCYGCHRTLDPMRDFFRQSYTYWGSPRTVTRNNETVGATAAFSVEGSPVVSGRGVGDFANALANHNGFAKAWVLKICGLANARPCSADDPEVVRLSDAFVRSNYNFKALLREVLASPIITYLARTKTWDDTGATAGIALREDFCRRLENRLGIRDACGARGEIDASTSLRNEIRGYAGSIPGAVYGRGDIEPQMPIAAGPFSTAAAERLCERLAGRFISAGSGSVTQPLFDAANKDAAIATFVQKLMGVSTTDARYAELRTVLTSHWDEVIATKQPAAIALQSTFVLACTAPFTTSTGL